MKACEIIWNESNEYKIFKYIFKTQCIHRFFQNFNDLKCIKNHIIMKNVYTHFDVLIYCHFFVLSIFLNYGFLIH